MKTTIPSQLGTSVRRSGNEAPEAGVNNPTTSNTSTTNNTTHNTLTTPAKGRGNDTTHSDTTTTTTTTTANTYRHRGRSSKLRDHSFSYELATTAPPPTDLLLRSQSLTYTAASVSSVAGVEDPFYTDPNRTLWQGQQPPPEQPPQQQQQYHHHYYYAHYGNPLPPPPHHHHLSYRVHQHSQHQQPPPHHARPYHDHYYYRETTWKRNRDDDGGDDDEQQVQRAGVGRRWREGRQRPDGDPHGLDHPSAFPQTNTSTPTSGTHWPAPRRTSRVAVYHNSSAEHEALSPPPPPLIPHRPPPLEVNDTAGELVCTVDAALAAAESLKKAARRLCRFPGCSRVIKSQGHCQRHGAKAKRCRMEGCDKQAQGTHDGMCKRHWKMANLPSVHRNPGTTERQGESVYARILPQSISYRPSRQPEIITIMPLVTFLREGCETEGHEAGWHRNGERRARGIPPIQSLEMRFEPWERQLVLVEILLLSGGTPGADFHQLAYAWGREEGFHHQLVLSICEGRGEVERKRRLDAPGSTASPSHPSEQRLAIQQQQRLQRFRSHLESNHHSPGSHDESHGDDQQSQPPPLEEHDVQHPQPEHEDYIHQYEPSSPIEQLPESPLQQQQRQKQEQESLSRSSVVTHSHHPHRPHDLPLPARTTNLDPSSWQKINNNDEPNYSVPV